MMLINELGTEDDGNVVDLDERREMVTVDPKDRVTMAMLLQAALTSNEADAPVPPPRRESSVARLTVFPAEATSTDDGMRADVA